MASSRHPNGKFFLIRTVNNSNQPLPFQTSQLLTTMQGHAQANKQIVFVLLFLESFSFTNVSIISKDNIANDEMTESGQ